MTSDQIRHIFFPYTDLQTKTIKAEGRRFAYYTTAATAHSIIRNSELWMRSTSTMNDYREVEHGFDCLKAAMNSTEGVELKAAIDAHFPGLSKHAIDYFDSGWLPNIRQDTYITCVSEHFQHENHNGRLSMWRAYGGNSGIALVLRPDLIFRTDDVGIYSSPVAYWTQPQVQTELTRITKRIQENAALISATDPELILNILLNMFRFAVLGIKHPGFAEEHEWRFITCPTLKKSPLLEQHVEVVRGTPQQVQRIHLKDVPEDGIQGLTLKTLLERVIIGPCEYPYATYKAMIQLLKDAGFDKPSDFVHVSDIPLRIATA